MKPRLSVPLLSLMLAFATPGSRAATFESESLEAAANDPDDQVSEATVLGPAARTYSRSGEIDSATDVDMFSVSVQAGQRLSFDVDRPSSGFDSLIRLFDTNGIPLAVNNDAPGPGETSGVSSYLEYTFASGGTFFLGVSGNANSNYDAVTGAGDVNGSTGSYRLIVSPGLAGTIRRPGSSTDYPVDILRFGSNAPAIAVNQRTWIVIHGWNSSRTAENIFELANSLYQTRPGDQVLSLDWSEAANTGIFNPSDAENSIVPVAEWAAIALKGYGFVGTHLNLMGHSFGSYVADEIAQRIPGGVNTIVTLDPAANVFGGYDPVSQVDFTRDALFSWSFHSSSLGNEYTPVTAHETFIVDGGSDPIAAHSNVVLLFAYMLMFPDDPVGQFFLLNYLLNAMFGPWAPDQYTSYFPGDDPVRGYEAIIMTGSDGITPQSIVFVTNAPVLAITSHGSGQTVMANPILLAGTATDAGRGGSGISTVLVNGVAANNSTASGTEVAHWSRTAHLNYGTNIITVVAWDNDANAAATTNTIAIHFVALPVLAVSVTNDSVAVSWHVAYSGFVVEQNSTPGSAAGWNEVTNAAAVMGESNVVTLPASGAGQFFRLKQ